jgi:threonyl-tRNA synthetase
MAQAVKRLYPDVKLAIGPAIDAGFYYDFDKENAFTTEDLDKIQAEMKKIVKENLTIEKKILSYEDAKEVCKDEPYKLELIEKHKDSELSFYTQGEFTDFCAGPHVMRTGNVKQFKLLSTTGAYWRGDSKNKVLSRIYGVAFAKKDELDAHLERLEQAKLRDHNKLGRDLELFTTVDVIGQGLPVLLPKGARIVQILQRFVEDEEQKRGYLLTKTPLMAKPDIYKISGHWQHYREGMFVIGDADAYDRGEGNEVLALRPMTCPFQYQVFLNKKRSYRDLPMRLGETSTLFRNEDSGEMHGLIRVRHFTISEGHIILRPEQLEDEFRECVTLAKEMLTIIGLGEDVSYRFSQWDPNNTGKYEGTPEQWEEAQNSMQKILDHLGLEYEIGIGEAAFY